MSTNAYSAFRVHTTTNNLLYYFLEEAILFGQSGILMDLVEKVVRVHLLVSIASIT